MLQWADTFNRYGTNAALMLNGLYAEVNSSALVADIDPSSTQRVLQHTPNIVVNEGYRFAYPSGSINTIGFALRLWLPNLPVASATWPAWEIRDSNNAPQISITIGTTGTISVYRGQSTSPLGTLLGTTTVPVVSANAYNHIEAKIFIDAVVGTVEIRVNGVTVLNLTGQNTKNTAVTGTAQIVYVARIGAPVSYHKDFIIWDTTGTFNNNFLGSVSVVDIDTNADTSLTWTPSTGTTGYGILDNNPPLDDAAYIAAATSLSNTFGLADLPADTTSVRGLVLVNRSRKIDGGDGNVQMGIISGASTGLGSNRPITTAYTYWRDVIEADPATGAQFTPSAFNAASFKLARTV